jgi:hypothetical protein
VCNGAAFSNWSRSASVALGIVGEYVGAIHTQVINRPLVIEQERINF